MNFENIVKFAKENILRAATHIMDIVKTETTGVMLGFGVGAAILGPIPAGIAALVVGIVLIAYAIYK